MPGVKPEDIDITYEKGMLTVKGQLKDESETAKGQYQLRERRYGAFSRTINLPATVKAEDIQANYQDGVLTLKMPKAEEVKPKRIAIRAADGQKVIEGKNER